MGIHVNLDIVPQRISQEQWHEVYQESLKLVEAFPFLDVITRSRNGYEYRCGTRSKSRRGVYRHECYGWYSIGDMETGSNTEDFEMYDNIRVYMEGRLEEDNGIDVLLERADMEEGRYPSCVRNVFGGKTQGERSHIPLLAIACLLESRLPEGAAAVSGTINLAQCRQAVEWANQFLDEPVMLPVIGRKEALYERLVAAGLDGEELVQQMLCLTLDARGRELGSFFQEKQPDGWYAYFRTRLKAYGYETRGFETILKEYLEMGGDFSDLCRMLVTDPDGKQISAEEFLRVIIRIKLHVQEKQTYDFTRTDQQNAEKAEVDGIGMMMRRVFGELFGLGNHNVDAYIPLEQIKAACKEVFSENCDVDEVISRVLDEQAEEDQKESVQSVLYDGKLEEMAQAREREKKEQAEQYDVPDKENLDKWSAGCRVEPQLEKWLLSICGQLHEFSKKHFEHFRRLDRQERENFFIRRHEHYILLMDTVWDQIWDGIMDDEYIERIHALWWVDTGTQNGPDICSMMYRYPEMYQYYWEATRG